MRRYLTVAIGSLSSGLAFAPQTALACAACSGKSNDALVSGLNAGIFTLLVVLLFVLSMFAMVFARFIWLQSKHSDLTIRLPGLAGNPHQPGGMSS